MNKERILAIADWLATNPREFDMASTLSRRHPACGTVCCIAGKAVIDAGKADAFLEGYDFSEAYLRWERIKREARWYLDVGEAVADSLFEPMRMADGVSYTEVTTPHAEACLRRLAETGHVDWLTTKPIVDPEALFDDPEQYGVRRPDTVEIL